MSATECLDGLVQGGVAADFGQAIAASGPLAAVSEPSRNRVHLFREGPGPLSYLGTIKAPPGLPPAALPGQGFGHALALSGERLLIGDFVEAPQTPSGGRGDADGWTRRGGLYLTPARPGAEPRPILQGSLPEGAVHGYAVALEGEQLAASFRRREASGAWRGAIALGAAEGGSLRIIQAPPGAAPSGFGDRIALEGGRLLASFAGAGAAFLYAGQAPPRRVPAGEPPPDLLTEDVALAGALAVVGGRPRGPMGGAAVVVSLTDGAVRVVRPSGAVTATDWAGIVAPAEPRSLGRGPAAAGAPPALRVLPTSGDSRSSPLLTPAGQPVRTVTTAAAAARWLFLALGDGPGCRVLATPLAARD